MKYIISYFGIDILFINELLWLKCSTFMKYQNITINWDVKRSGVIMHYRSNESSNLNSSF